MFRQGIRYGESQGSDYITLMVLTELKIILHNVLAWTKERRNELTNYYYREQPDVILINATGTRQNDKLKFFNYNVYERNDRNELHAGIAIAVKKDLQHQILDDFQEEILSVKIMTTKGPVIVMTHYSPPRANYLPIGDIRRMFQKNMPVYLMADINANHHIFGYRRPNDKGKIIKELIDRNIANYLGPDFPTLVGKSTKPDMILSNRHGFSNIAIEPGAITTSDHIPIKIKLSTKAILKDIQPRRNYSKANWTKYKEIIEEEITKEERENPIDENSLRQMDRGEIDKLMGNWMTVIGRAANESIPENKKTYYAHLIESDYIKLLEQTYNNLLRRDNWIREQLQLIRNIQQELREESSRLVNEMWDQKINKIDDIYNNPTKFWRKIAQMMGSNAPKTDYLLDTSGVKKFLPQEKERCFNIIWMNIFQISDAENQLFDQEHERRIDRYMDNHYYEAEPYARPDWDRLNEEDYMIKPATDEEIKRIIQSFKNNKSPGESKINKILLIQLPDNAITRYRKIINSAFSMGYFPIILKKWNNSVNTKKRQGSQTPNKL